MRTCSAFLAIILFSGAGACGGDGGSGPGTTDGSIAGAYAGKLVSHSQSVRIDVAVTLNIHESGATVSGTWGFSGLLIVGDIRGSVHSVRVNDAGTFSGTVAPGNDPSVSIMLRTPPCPDYQASFTGTYDAPSRSLTLSGPFQFLISGSCTRVLSYPSTIILTR